MVDGIESPALQQFDRVRATFQPRRTDDLKPEGHEAIGRRGEWEAGWLIDEGQYAGQWAMLPCGATRDAFPFGWAPLCDLVDIDRMLFTEAEVARFLHPHGPREDP